MQIKNFCALMAFLIFSASIVSPVQATTNTTPMESWQKPVLVLDPGHGGIDGGTQSADGSVLEKDLNLQIAKQLAERLRKDGLAVVMTRESDEDVTKYAPKNRGFGRHMRDLYGRVEFTRQQQATVIVSLHGNHGSSKNRGAVVFYQVSSPESYLLATDLQMRLNQTTNTFHVPEKGNFYIIRKPNVPSVLVEYGYLSHAQELAQLQDPAYQKKLVNTLTEGIYFFLIFYHLPRCMDKETHSGAKGGI